MRDFRRVLFRSCPEAFDLGGNRAPPIGYFGPQLPGFERLRWARGAAGEPRGNRRLEIVEAVVEQLEFLEPLLCIEKIDPRERGGEAHILRGDRLLGLGDLDEIGRASCRERVCQYV